MSNPEGLFVSQPDLDLETAVSAVLAQIEDLSIDDQIEVLNEALMRQEVAPID